MTALWPRHCCLRNGQSDEQAEPAEEVGGGVVPAFRYVVSGPFGPGSSDTSFANLTLLIF